MTVTETAPSRPRRIGGLLHQHDFRMLWVGETTSRLGTTITGIAIPLIAVDTLHASTFLVGLLDALAWLPWLLIGLPAGVLTDRLSRRPTMLVCDAVSVLLLLSVPLLAFAGALTMTHLLVVALLLGVTTVFFTTAYQAYLPTVVAKEDLPEGNAKLQASDQAAAIAGPGIGGLIAQFVGAVFGLLIDIVTFVVSACCLLRIRSAEPPPAGSGPRRSLRADVGEGLSFVSRDPYLRVLVTCGAIDNFVLTATHSLLVVFLIRDVGVSPGTTGLLLTADAIGGVLGALVATRFARRFGTGRGLLYATLGSAPFGLLIPLTDVGPGLLFFFFGLLVPAAGLVIGNVIAAVFRQSYTPPELIGRVFASARFIQFGVIPLGAVTGGWAGTVLGVRDALWLLLILGLLGRCVRLVGPPARCRDLPTSPPVR
ncbi:MFS transporter [Actinophytocola sp.]|uniref:MFS transporter n=1 Tax=Actinophytocola sp. TaxID=1872138 RepID=UPI002ED51E19